MSGLYTLSDRAHGSGADADVAKSVDESLRLDTPGRADSVRRESEVFAESTAMMDDAIEVTRARSSRCSAYPACAPPFTARCRTTGRDLHRDAGHQRHSPGGRVVTLADCHSLPAISHHKIERSAHRPGQDQRGGRAIWSTIRVAQKFW
jgi:hypothetical protein